MVENIKCFFEPAQSIRSDNGIVSAVDKGNERERAHFFELKMAEFWRMEDMNKGNNNVHGRGNKEIEVITLSLFQPMFIYICIYVCILWKEKKRSEIELFPVFK